MIIYFSGTGNTRLCAKALAARLGDTTLELAHDSLRNPASAEVSIPDGRVIWMFPTYSWGVPPVVRHFMEQASLIGADNADHWMVTTCGDDVGRCAAMWRRSMKHRGYRAVSAFSVTMPNTYVCMKGFDVDDSELAQQKLDAMDERITEIANKIKSHKPSYTTPQDDVVCGKYAWFKTAVIYPWFVKFDMNPRPFHTTEACTACGRCIRHCPMDNITADANGRPVWHDRCAFCLGCYHACPSHAVAHGRSTLAKGQKPIY